MKLGIDIGRVIIAPDAGDAADTSFIGGPLAAALATPPYTGMFDALPELVRLFGGRAWLVSKCGPSVQEKTRRWLEHHDFHARCGIPADHVRFCLQRPQKADHCRELGITHFIDDRVDVLQHLNGIVPRRYLFGPQRAATTAAGVTPCIDWPTTLARVRADLALG
jgi:hypothetical protein